MHQQLLKIFHLNQALIYLRPTDKYRLNRRGVSICRDGGIYVDLPAKFALV